MTALRQFGYAEAFAVAQRDCDVEYLYVWRAVGTSQAPGLNESSDRSDGIRQRRRNRRPHDAHGIHPS